MSWPRAVRPVVVGAFLAVLVCAPLAGRQTASISGQVINERGNPVPRARVGVARGNPTSRTVVNTTADDSGRFVLEGLPAATYTLALSKPGHVNTAFGQAFPGAPAIEIPLQEGERRDVVARLARSSVIAGVVRGDDGEPEPGVLVRAVRWAMFNGRRSYRNEGSANRTNSRGEYRIWNLPAGRYILTADPPTEGMQITAAGADHGEFRYPRRYYPGVSLPALAQTFAVGAGVEVTGIDIGMAMEPAGTLVADVVNPASTSISRIEVVWHPPEPDAFSGAYARRAEETSDGRFVMRAVPTGRHVVTARATVRGGRGQNPPPLWASMPVFTTGGTDQVTLVLEPGATIAGRILSRDDPRDLNISRIRPLFRPVGVPPGDGQFMDFGERERPGLFEVAVPPGEFRLEVSGLPPGWIALEAVIDGRDVLDGTVVVRSGDRVDSMAVVVGERGASVAGMVTDAKGSPAYLSSVVVFPVDHALRRMGSRWIHLAQPDIDGRYALDDLAPGDYFIVAAPIDWNPSLETERLQDLEAVARRVSLDARERLRLDLMAGR